MSSKTPEEILRHYRTFADVAWSEVTDKVHTVAEYHKALQYLTDQHVTMLNAHYKAKILSLLKDEPEYPNSLGTRDGQVQSHSVDAMFRNQLRQTLRQEIEKWHP